MSNEHIAQANDLIDSLELKDLIKMREQLDAEISTKRPSVIYEHYLGFVDFLRNNNLDIREYCEIGGRQYIAENKRKKAPLTLPATTGSERKLTVKYSDGQNNWAGRGRIPKWLAEAMTHGHNKEEFLVK